MEHSPTALASPFTRLVQAVEEGNCILFVGAGVSMAVGLPSWSELIERMRRELDLSAESDGVTFQTLAEYYRLTQGSIGGLRSWMDRAWSVSEERVRDSGIHRRIVELQFPLVYTTNFDNNLEVAYQLHDRQFVKIVNARDLTRTASGLPQIIKFHGDFTDDESLVLAETDYLDRLAFPPSFVFVTTRDPVRDEVLEQWGISVLSNDEATPGGALLAGKSPRSRSSTSCDPDP
jgi:hypothetical protein